MRFYGRHVREMEVRKVRVHVCPNAVEHFKSIFNPLCGFFDRVTLEGIGEVEVGNR